MAARCWARRTISVAAHGGGEPVPLDGDSIKKLGNRLRGGLVLPGHADYDQVRRVWNGMVDKHPAILSKAELIDLVLRLKRPGKTSRTSSKPPSTDRKERCERAKPGGAKPGHEGHSRPLSDDVSKGVAHRPEVCPCCRIALASDLPAEEAGIWERIELPVVRPQVVHHHRLAVRCPGCGTQAVAPVPVSGTPFGPRLHAVATYLKTFQALSYERLQATLAELFGLRLSQGGLMNLLRRT